MRAASTADTSRSKRQRVIAGDDDDVDDKGSDNDEDDIDAIIANAIEADGAFDDNRDVDAPDEGVANNDDNGENNDDDDAQIDLSKINTKLTAAEKRNLFAPRHGPRAPTSQRRRRVDQGLLAYVRGVPIEKDTR